MGSTVKLEGFKELDAALADLTKATAGNVLKRALMKGAEIIANDAKGKAPVDTGKLAGSIAATTRVPAIADPGKQAFAEAMSKGLTKAQAGKSARDARRAHPQAFARAFVGVYASAKVRGIWQEFGTSVHTAQPYMRPAFDNNAQAVLGGLKGDIRAELDRAAARAARKAAKLAAKAGG